MKGFVFVLAVSLLIYSGCHTERLATKEEKVYNETVELIESYMVPDAELSAERPAPDLLSEQEVMIRVAEYVVQQGYLDPAHPIYEEMPELANAKVAEPIFVYYEDELQQGKVNGFYNIYTTTADGATKIEGSFFSQETIPDGTDAPTFGITYNQFIPPKHIITESECEQIYENIFLGKNISKPMAICTQTSKTGFLIDAWYVEVSDGSRSAGGSHEEYLLDMTVFDLPPQQSISTNPRAALSRSTVSGGWRTRIARIDEPLRLHEKLAKAKARATAGEPEPAVGPTPVKITPVEF